MLLGLFIEYLIQAPCQLSPPPKVKMLVSLETRRVGDSRRWRSHEGNGGSVGTGEGGVVTEKNTREDSRRVVREFYYFQLKI